MYLVSRVRMRKKISVNIHNFTHPSVIPTFYCQMIDGFDFPDDLEAQ